MNSNISKVAFIVNGVSHSPMGQRANSFMERLEGAWDIHVFYREMGLVAAVRSFYNQLKELNPEIIYVFDLSAAGALAASIYKIRYRVPIIVDTGDVITEVAKTLGRGVFGRLLTSILEYVILRFADHIVVRGTFHRELLAKFQIDSTIIQDGVDVNEIIANMKLGPQSKLNEEDHLVVGVVGSAVWNKKTRSCYGREIVDALSLLKDTTIKGVLVGDGSGVDELKNLARDLGVDSQMIFAGRQSGVDLYRWLSAMDVCVSTQSNDLVGQVRTTGKLPLYMAAGKFVLATEVGEAKLVLDEAMLVPYEGAADPDYPKKLAKRLREIDANRVELEMSGELQEAAKRHFSYDMLAQKLHVVLAKWVR